MTMVLVGVCGGRQYANRDLVRNTLSELRQRIEADTDDEMVIIHGDARGADYLAGAVARQLGIHYGAFPANWEVFGKGAGPRRNAVMAALPLRYLVAFPGGAGTADMVRQCRAKRIEVIDLRSQQDTSPIQADTIRRGL